MLSRRVLRVLTSALLSVAPLAAAQVVAAPLTITSAGLRSSGNRGSFKAAQYTSDGSLILLYDGGDGLRLLKTDASATNVTAQVREGAAGDSGVAMTLDPAGNIYVAGTSTSGSLAGTSGVPFRAAADTTTNSFLAKFDANLHLLYLTFLGAGTTVVAGVAATDDAVFVAGVTYSSAFPVTSACFGQAPATGSYGNGFVERFGSAGTALNYATYLTGTGGDTLPAAIAVNTADEAIILGQTSAPGYPTAAALQPQIIGLTSGFVTELTPAGDNVVFSTYIAGSGLTSLAVDANNNTLLLTGNVSFGQFPVSTVVAPIANTTYQSLLRLTSDGQTLKQSVLLVPGTESFVTPGPNGTAWVSGALGTPLLPPALTASITGDSVLLHVTQDSLIDQALRLGGNPLTDAGYATFTSKLAAPALSPDGQTIALLGTVYATASASLVSTQHFDFPLSLPTPVLPNAVTGLLPASCTGGSECFGSGGLLALAGQVSSTVANLNFSAGDLPNLTLRNVGPAAATGMTIAATGFEVSTSCGSTLPAFAECGLALNGTGPGSVTLSASNAAAVTIAIPAQSATPQVFAFSPSELDFGIVTSNSPVSRTVTVSNLSGAAQNFSSSSDGAPTTPPYTLAEVSSTCAGTADLHTLPADSACTITLGLTASAAPADDGPVRAFWKLGARDLAITGITQAAALSVSATEIDFGAHFNASGTGPLPRYLYLSNSSEDAISHAVISLPAGSPFTVADACPSTLEPGSVCQIGLTYTQAEAPAEDSATLLLDAGLSVLVTGETLAAPVPGNSQNVALSISANSLSFATPVVATGLSSETQVLGVTNAGTTPFPLAVAVTSEFRISNICGPVLNPGATCDLTVQFAPSQPGVREGLLSLATGGGFDPLLISLSGIGTVLLPANNGTLALGQTSVGEPIVRWYKVQAAVGTLTASVTGSAFAVTIVEDDGAGHGTPASSAFSTALTSSCANCWLGIQFYPQTTGQASSVLTLSTVDGGNTDQLALTASSTAVQGLVLNAAISDFGTVPLGSSTAPVTFTLTNLLSPATAVSFSSATATGDFSVVTNTTGGASCQGSLASTASCYIEISFTPTAIGKRDGVLTVQTSGGPVVLALLGTGTASPGLALNPTSLTFRNEPGIGSTQQSVTLTNTSASNLTVGAMAASTSSFAIESSCKVIAPGATCVVAITFTPGDAEIAGSFTIPVSTVSNGQILPATYIVPLSATYTANNTGVTLLPSQVDFGSQVSGELGTTRQFTLINTSAAAQSIALVVPAQFPLAAPFNCGTLAVGASCTFSVSFLPETGGALTGSLVATSTTAGSNTPRQAISYLLGYGTASGSLTIAGEPNPGTPVNFGQMSSGQTAQQTLTLSNNGSGPVNVRRVVSAPPFLAETTCGPALAPGGQCAIIVTYVPVFLSTAAASPLLPRPDVATLAIESDAASSPNAIALMGTVTAGGTGGPATTSSSATYTLSQGALTFANTQVGDSSAAQMLTLLNTGTQPLVIGSVIAPQDFGATTTCTTVAPGATCGISVTFTPGSESTAPLRAATLELQSDAATPLEFVSLLGMSSDAPLSISPGALDFGTVDLPSSDQLSVAVSNTASLPITFGQLSATGDYTVQAGTCPSPGSSLPAGQSCALVITFTPSATGTRTGLLSIVTDATELPLTVNLTGTGVQAKLQIAPGALAFGSISVDATASLALQLSNAGSGDLSGIATSIIGPNAADFAVTTPCTQAAIPPNLGCSLQVSFTPSAGGTRTATLVLTSSDPTSPTLIALSGTGTQAGSFVLTVGGQSTASVTVAAGMPATYSLMLTPQNGFAGAAALTCTPVSAAPYAGCALLSSQLTLTNGAQGSTVTITTVNGAVTRSELAPFGLLLLAPLTWLLRRRGQSGLQNLCTVVLLFGSILACASVAGCGGPGNNGLNLTPAGSYKYQVTANSISGTAVSSAVTLNLVVQ